MAQLDLRLLGPFRAYLDGVEVTGFQSNKARGLLAYVATEAHRPHSRTWLASLFWPDLEPSRAKTYLRHALANLRKILYEPDRQAPYLLVTRTTIGFNRESDAIVDIDGLRRDDVEESDGPSSAAGDDALERYTGPFLEGLVIEDCPEFEMWLETTRRQMHNRILDRLERLAQQAEENEQIQAAIRTTRRQLALEPWRERAHRRLMRLLSQKGDRAAALAQYETLVRILAEELDVPPAAETQMLYRQIVEHEQEPVQVEPQAQNGASIQAQGALPPHPRHPSGPISSLTPSLTPLIGRRHEVDEIAALVESLRLVTLVGPGGVGKTRLATAVAERVADFFADGVVTVSLAPVQQPDLVLNAIAAALCITIPGGQSIEERLQRYLADQHCLLVLDNFEHLLPAAVSVARLLQVCPRLHVLATSRAPLRIYGEQEVPVLPLALPEPDMPVDSLAQVAAVQLFVQRVQAARPSFTLTPENTGTIGAICTALDGLPLALELAAAQLKFMSSRELLDQLDRRVPPPWQGARDLPERHQTLAQTIDWSYRLLGSEEQRLFRWMGAFVGGFTREALHQVAVSLAAEDHARPTPERLQEAQGSIDRVLRTLIDHSLVQRLPGADAPARYTMLEMIRQTSADLLGRSGEDACVRKAHANHYLALAEEAEPMIRHLGMHPHLEVLDTESDNLRAALQWALDNSERSLAVRLGASLGAYWVARELLQEGMARLEALLPILDTEQPSVYEAKVFRYAGRLAELLGDYPRSQSLLERALTLARALDDPHEIAICLSYLAITLRTRGEFAAAKNTHSESLTLFEQITGAPGARYGIAFALSDLGVCEGTIGDLREAVRYQTEALAVAEEIGDAYVEAVILIRVGDALLRKDNVAGAQHYLDRSLTQFERVENTPSLYLKAYLLAQLGLLATTEENGRNAFRYLEQSLRMNRKSSHFWGQVHALAVCALVLAQRQKYEDAQCLLGYAVTALADAGATAQLHQKEVIDKARALVAAAPDQRRLEAAWRRGVRMTLEEASAFALKAIGA